ncbi:NAD(P)-binding domain-containing protein [Bradyrhizobium prioriisuperbiae]|uniref:NAD(P)-binding domain-containing protein n=1 Tax=Bradyrhizobium prioriisuperbiae TaxID=2854389 RepID=UPI0028EF83C5|nr:NAD(P)-binding domain-containing protein [Bradyrhizobium prioritasuperba]
MTTEHIALIGLGAMGRSVALHLANKREADSEKVVALDADPARLEGLVAPGLVATTDRERIAGAEVLFLCLPDGDVVETVLFGADGVAARLADGAIVVDLSTPRTARRWRSAGHWRHREKSSSMRRSPARPRERRPAR